MKKVCLLSKWNSWYYSHLYKFRNNPQYKLLVFILDYIAVPFVITYRDFFNPEIPLSKRILVITAVFLVWGYLFWSLLRGYIARKTKHHYEKYLREQQKINV